MKEHFKLRPGSFPELRKQILLRTVPLMLLATGGGLGISFLNSDNYESTTSTLPLVLPLFLLIMLVSLYSSMRKQKKIFESFELILEEETVTRKQYNTPDIRIARSEIKSIIKNSNGSFTIKGANLLNGIGIPAQVQDRERLESSLKRYCAVADPKRSFIWEYSTFFTVVVLTAMVGVFASHNKIIVGGSGVFVIIVLCWGFIVIQRSNNIDKYIKKVSWIVLIVLLSVIATTYMKIFGS